MKLYDQNKDCCGCGACAAVCGGAITMRQDREGFCYPCVDEKRCVRCGRCREVCPLKHVELLPGVHKYYGARNKDEPVRYQSSSGGIFSVLAEYVLEKSGSVFGAGYTDDMEVRHMEIKKREDLDRVRRTKYVQSQVDSFVYRSIRDRLKMGKWVLFTGTPCQTEALRIFLDEEYDRLILTDLVCYGAGSPGIWKKYIRYLNRRNKADVKEYYFRDKRNRDNGHTVSWKTSGGETSYSIYEDPYCRMYFRNVIIRPSCYECPYCRPERSSDFTIGDFWGIEKIRPDLDDGMGNSLVILHSPKGEKIWNELKGKYSALECRREDALQPRLKEPTACPENRGRFMRYYQYLPFILLAKRYRGKKFFS